MSHRRCLESGQPWPGPGAAAAARGSAWRPSAALIKRAKFRMSPMSKVEINWKATSDPKRGHTNPANACLCLHWVYSRFLLRRPIEASAQSTKLDANPNVARITKLPLRKCAHTRAMSIRFPRNTKPIPCPRLSPAAYFRRPSIRARSRSDASTGTSALLLLLLLLLLLGVPGSYTHPPAPSDAWIDSPIPPDDRRRDPLASMSPPSCCCGRCILQRRPEIADTNWLHSLLVAATTWSSHTYPNNNNSTPHA
jgi:hypothetical protein